MQEELQELERKIDLEKRVRGECKVKVGVLEDKIARLESRLRLEEAREELGAPAGVAHANG